ncbi:benzoate/H(+) symporter BenE family transporter [Kocuria sp. TGY1127_2]|uniref:benzoate/H(+) symporter BenE family transporter n=1 Tax=Kocuria sp. TGY1127_2 TaxID=2711328 RepID=UPI0015BC5EEA|nr:benzoate/H(+) symporter BenE family transporter [Kocuria sp. TGY1127_2]
MSSHHNLRASEKSNDVHRFHRGRRFHRVADPWRDPQPRLELAFEGNRNLDRDLTEDALNNLGDAASNLGTYSFERTITAIRSGRRENWPLAPEISSVPEIVFEFLRTDKMDGWLYVRESDDYPLQALRQAFIASCAAHRTSEALAAFIVTISGFDLFNMHTAFWGLLIRCVTSRFLEPGDYSTALDPSDPAKASPSSRLSSNEKSESQREPCAGSHSGIRECWNQPPLPQIGSH